MSIQGLRAGFTNINVGTYVGDTTCDTVRNAFIKVNGGFSWVSTVLGTITNNEAAMLGTFTNYNTTLSNYNAQLQSAGISITNFVPSNSNGIVGRTAYINTNYSGTTYTNGPGIVGVVSGSQIGTNTTGLLATNGSAQFLTGLPTTNTFLTTNGSGQFLTGLTAAQVAGLPTTNQFASTNQLNTLGLNDTNFALSIGLNDTNFALSIGLAGTNNANAISNSLLAALIATNATSLKTNGNGQFLTGITAAQVAGLPTTNQFASTNQLNTLGLNDTNFALSIGLNDTNFALSIGLAGTNNANAISNSLLAALIATNATSLKTNGNGQFLTGLTPGQTGSQPTNANLTGFASLGTNAFDAAGVASNLVAPLTALIYITITNWTTQ